MTENLKVVTYEGILGIEQATEVKSQLNELIERGYRIVVNLSRIEWIDLSIIQVLLSAKKTAIAKNLDLTFANLLSGPVMKAWYLAGITRTSDINGHDLGIVISDYLQGIR